MLLLSNHDSTIQFDRPPRPFELIKHLSFALRRRYMPLFWELAGMRAGGGGVTS